MTVQLDRVRLVPAEDMPVTPLPWLTEAYAALDGRGSSGPELATSWDLFAAAGARWPAAPLQFITYPDGEPVGFVVGEVRGFTMEQAIAAPHTLRARGIIHALAIRRADRNLGLGVEVVTMRERAEAVTREYAPVPRTNGLAIYFWLRAGYRPVCDNEEPALSRDPRFLWMVREKPVSGGTRGP